MEMLNIDTLEVSSVGYSKYILKVPYNYNSQEILVFKMLPVNYALREVNVQGEKPKVNLGLEPANRLILRLNCVAMHLMSHRHLLQLSLTQFPIGNITLANARKVNVRCVKQY